jgi:phosphohistidine swiveling domain-containing protein
MSAAERTVHFSVDGGGLTDIVRDLMLSERPDSAWRTLADGLIGEGGEAVTKAILAGSMKLVNDPDDFDLLLTEEDNDEEYLNDLHYIYAGRIRIDGTWWRPVAEVTRFGPEAHRHAAEHISVVPKVAYEGFDRSRREWSRICVNWYTGPREIYREVAGRWIILEPCGEPPFWWQPNNTVAEALASCLRAERSLENRGGNDRDTIAEMRQEVDEKLEGVIEARRMSTGAVNEIHEERALEREREQEARREMEYVKRLADITAKVIEQAGDDTFLLKLEDGRELTVPAAPFQHWALDRTALRHMAPSWELVSPSGMKMPGDNPFHTDWMLGAGLDLREDYGYDKAVTRAAHDASFDLQRALGNFEANVIVDNGTVTGIVGENVVVLPNLSPDHTVKVMGAKAIITERGGQLAHLAVVGMEMGWTIMLVKDAMTRYPEGMEVTLNPAEGLINCSWL